MADIIPGNPKKILKFLISVSNPLDPWIQGLPKDAKFLHVAIQEGFGPCVWVEVDPARDIEDRSFQVFETGQNIPDEYQHIGTWQHPPFVWHLYEVL